MSSVRGVVASHCVQVAALLNRTVLWPDVPCAARWVTKGEPQLLHQVRHASRWVRTPRLGLG